MACRDRGVRELWVAAFEHHARAKELSKGLEAAEFRALTALADASLVSTGLDARLLRNGCAPLSLQAFFSVRFEGQLMEKVCWFAGSSVSIDDPVGTTRPF